MAIPDPPLEYIDRQCNLWFMLSSQSRVRLGQIMPMIAGKWHKLPLLVSRRLYKLEAIEKGIATPYYMTKIESISHKGVPQRDFKVLQGVIFL